MKKISLGGISLALLIGAFYAFIFCMTSVIPSQGLDVSDLPVVTEESVPYFEDTEGGVAFVTEPAPAYSDAMSTTLFMAEGTQEHFEDTAAPETSVTTVVPMVSVSEPKPETTGKPAATTVKTTAAPVTATTPKITTTAPVTTTAPKATTTAPVTTTTPKATTTAPVTTTTPKATTTAPVTTTTPKATTTAPVTTTPVTTAPNASTTAPVTTPAPSAGGYGNEKLTYKTGGVTYTGNAYDVICQAVNAEMGSSFNEEALKAQAVAAYSYIKYSNNLGLVPSISLKGNVSDKVKNAVSAVAGEAVYYNGKIAQTVYCASSGGYTASSADVWGTALPYLSSVESVYDVNNRDYGVTVKFTESEMRSMLESKTGLTLSNNPENWIVINNTVSGGYVGSVSIDGNNTYFNGKNNVAITGRSVREELLSFKIKSAKFTVNYSDGIFTFTTYGYGHGVGMPQLGANGYANAGWNYRQILEHYYSGATIS